MKYKIFLHPKAAELKNLNSSLRVIIKKCLRELEESPEEKGQRLRYSSFYRLRIGDYRAIYEINQEERTVIVLFIGHRRTVYDNLRIF